MKVLTRSNPISDTKKYSVKTGSSTPSFHSTNQWFSITILSRDQRADFPVVGWLVIGWLPFMSSVLYLNAPLPGKYQVISLLPFIMSPTVSLL